MLTKLANAFRPVKEVLENGRIAIHEDYKVDDKELPINYKPEIVRHVLCQGILNKADFISFVNEYKTAATKLFYNDDRIKAVFNYSTVDKADHGDSVCSMQLQTTDDYKEFQRHQNELTQKQFVRFLKRMEPYIIAFDGKQADDMDIIEMAEHLQAIKTIDSVQRNAQQKFHLDVNINTGSKSSVELPRVITFEFPIFKNDYELTTKFDTELFLSADDGSLTAELICYNIDQLYEASIKELTESILHEINDVKAFQS